MPVKKRGQLRANCCDVLYLNSKKIWSCWRKISESSLNFSSRFCAKIEFMRRASFFKWLAHGICENNFSLVGSVYQIVLNVIFQAEKLELVHVDVLHFSSVDTKVLRLSKTHHACHCKCKEFFSQCGHEWCRVWKLLHLPTTQGVVVFVGSYPQ